VTLAPATPGLSLRPYRPESNWVNFDPYLDIPIYLRGDNRIWIR
jgi:hypothetical protein